MVIARPYFATIIKSTGNITTYMESPIDNIDFSILKCVKAADNLIWKKKIHQYINEELERLPLQSDVSAQTVGRHVDKLSEDGLLESEVTSAEEVNRHLIIGFQITEDGERTLEEKRETLLKGIISREIFDTDTFPIEKEALEELIQDEFTAGLSINEVTQRYTRKQLLLLLGMYFIEQDAAAEFTEEQRQQFHKLAQETTL